MYSIQIKTYRILPNVSPGLIGLYSFVSYITYEQVDPYIIYKQVG
jgi:hypothetical protein